VKITQVCNYIAPARDSMGAERVVEYLTKGLVELGHTVEMKLHPDTLQCPVEGASLVSEISSDTDVIQFHGWEKEYFDYGNKWFTLIHGYSLHQLPELAKDNPRVIAVSKFAANSINVPNFVHTCVDPSMFAYKDKKQDYFLWMAGLDWGEGKGLFTTITLAKILRIKLKIAGAGKNQNIINEVKRLCDDKIEFVGPVNGKEKAELLANAKAYILLTQLPDACPATISEALISGTPIIGSTMGALPELVNKDVGILCDGSSDFAKAVATIGKIKPKDCYDYAMENFHYVKAAKKFLQIYESVLK
jgi:hypothetical protein